MLRSPGFRTILLIWLVWWLVLFGYQELVRMRYDVQRPDTAVFWTPGETRKTSQNDKPYLLDPFFNTHVSWDSEFYLGAAEGGYDNPKIRSIPGPGPNGKLSLSYAFFPLYAFVMRLLSAPLRVFGLTPTATVTLAGLIVSLLGTLAGMFALYDLSRDWLGEKGGVRAAFYLLIFPTGFFLAQIYTEGLFAGLAFSALALLHRKKFLPAGLLSALAVWTRPVGVALAVPLALAAWQTLREKSGPRQTALAGLAALLPLASLGAWWLSPFREKFWYIEAHFFGRGFLLGGQSAASWGDAWEALTRSGNGPSIVYYGLEFLIAAIALLGCLAMLRKVPGLALFSLAVFGISFFSGAAQSFSRYALGIPAMFIGLSKLGENEAFDRGWTLTSILLMGMQAALFSFDMWVA